MAPTARGVIFDLFGTLVPEYPASAWRRLLRAMGEVLEVEGDGFVRAWEALGVARQTGVFADGEACVRGALDRLGAEATGEAVADAVAMRERFMLERFRPIDGAVETVEGLRGRGLGVAMVSNCSPEVPELWAASPFGPLFEVTVFSSEAGVMKPDPLIYRLATDALGVDPAACVFVGDGAYGELTGAEALGMTAVMIRHGVDDDGYRPDEELAWNGLRVSSFAELEPLLA
jgi:putative hydrolase of the HAD superfamily